MNHRYIPLQIILLLLLPLAAYAQTAGTVQGTVTEAASELPMPGVNVGLQGTGFGSATDEDGAFSITGIAPGMYTLVVSFVGYQAQRQRIEVRSNQTTTLTVTLAEAPLELQEVEVVGRRETGYQSRYSFAATKTAARPVDIPQALSSVTKELMDDRQSLWLPDVVKNISGVNQNTMWNDLNVRGFRNHAGGSGFRLLNGLRGGFGFFTNPLLVNIERVEVLKGPGSALYGNINPGGTINMVTKKPLAEPRKAVSFSVGSYNNLRSLLDVTGPLNANRTLLYRINVGYEQNDTFRDFSSYNAFSMAPTVTFVPTDRTTLNAELVYSLYDGYLDRGVAIPGQDLDGADLSLSLSQPSDWYKVEDVYFNAALNHRFTDALSLNVAYLRFAWDENLAEHRTRNNWVDTGEQTISSMRYWERIDQRQTDNLSAYLTVRTETGPARHTLVTGADYAHFYTDGGTVWEARQRYVPTERTIPMPDGEDLTVTELVQEDLTFDLRNPLYRHRGNDIANYVFRRNRDIGDRESEYRTLGLYVQDQVDFGRLKALVGLRYEFYRDELDRTLPDDADTQDQNIFVPRIGLTFGLTESVNAYANVSRGFIPIDPIYIYQPELFRPDGSTSTYDHETSELFEVGAKGEFLDGDLLATVALFQITKANSLQQTGQVNSLGNDVIEQIGEVRSRGVEFEIVGQLQSNLSVNAHYTYNPTEILETDDDTQRGETAVGVPTHLAGMWAKYLIEEGELRGLGIGVGFHFVGDRRHRFLTADLNTGDRTYQEWPSYTVFDAAVYYNINQFKLSLNINNVFDTRYWLGGYDFLRANPGIPRHAIATIGYTF